MKRIRKLSNSELIHKLYDEDRNLLFVVRSGTFIGSSARKQNQP